MAGLLFNKAKDHLQRRLSRTVRRLRQDRSSERRKLQGQHGESCASTSTDARGNIWMPQACKILRAKFPASPTCLCNGAFGKSPNRDLVALPVAVIEKSSFGLVPQPAKFVGTA